MLFRLLIILSSFTILLSGCATQSKKELLFAEVGLQVQSQVPEIKAVGIDGKSKTIKELSGNKGLALILFRSADWCPFCQRELIDMNDWHDKITALGYNMAAISYDRVEVLKEFMEDKEISFPLLSDQNYQTFKRLNVLNREYKKGDSVYGIPYPGVMVIDTQGKLSYQFFYKGYKKRIGGEDLYNALKQ